jgi:hypothetical protein
MVLALLCDGVFLNLESELVERCKTLSQCVEGCGENMIPIPNVNSETMKRIIEFSTTGNLSSTENMLELMMASDYLNYEELLDYGAKVVADGLRGKSPVEIRRYFGIEVNPVS